MSYNLMDDFCQGLADTNMILRSCRPVIDQFKLKYGDEFCSLVERSLELSLKMGWKVTDILTEYLTDYLREQISFIQTGEYGHGTFEEIKSKIYDNDELMLNSYLPGLFLAYSFTPVLYEKYHFFINSFLPLVQDGDEAVELGFGDAFYLWNLMSRRRLKTMSGYDISPAALKFAAGLLGQAGLAGPQLRLERADICQGIPGPEASYDQVILAEVVEHLPRPEEAVREARRLLKTGGHLFLSTVIDSNHMDHMTNFKNASEVKTLIENQGLIVIDELYYRLRDAFPAMRDGSIGLAYVGRAA